MSVTLMFSSEAFSWDAAKGEICIVTTLLKEEIMVFFFRGVHRVTAETVEINLRIAVKVPPVEKIISSPRFRIRLRWMHTYNSYEMSEIARLNSSLTQALRVRVNPTVISQNFMLNDVQMFELMPYFIVPCSLYSRLIYRVDPAIDEYYFRLTPQTKCSETD
ncbi:hypothetical protein ACTXT7_000700 [Hymenolepis weldensis]